MKTKRYLAWIEVDDKGRETLGIYNAFEKKQALIRAQSDAIKIGIDYKLVKVAKDKD